MFSYFEDHPDSIFTGYKRKSYDFPSHFHRNIEITYCFSGLQKVRIGNEIYELSAGDVIVIFPDVIHEYIKCENAQDTESVSLMGKLDFYAGIIPELQTKVPALPYIMAENVPECSAQAFRQMVGVEDKIMLLGLSFQALSGIMRCLELVPKKNMNENIAATLIEYINENFQSQISINSLGREFGYTSSYIAHVFCEKLRVPFKKYIGTIRCKYAAELIETTDKSITEIAFESGFSSLNTFCRNFKKYNSYTPVEYRKVVKSKKS